MRRRGDPRSCILRLGGPGLVLVIGLACAADERVVYSDEEPTEPIPQRAAAAAAEEKPPAASSSPGLSYARSLLSDPARAGERFDFVSRLARGEERMQPELVAPLKRLLADKDEGLRANAVQALGRSGDSGALQAILDRLGDSSPAVRKAAVGALADAEGSGVYESLAALLTDPRNGLRRAAAAALGQRSGAGFPGAPPDGDDAEAHMRYLELTAVTGREDLFRVYIAPGQGRNAGLLYRVTPAAAADGDEAAPRPQSFQILAPELTAKRFAEEVAPGLMVDLEGEGPACSEWSRGKAECRSLTDLGQRYRVELRRSGNKVLVAEIEWFPQKAR